jgi:hypothetical protein
VRAKSHTCMHRHSRLSNIFASGENELAYEGGDSGTARASAHGISTEGRVGSASDSSVVSVVMDITLVGTWVSCDDATLVSVRLSLVWKDISDAVSCTKHCSTYWRGDCMLAERQSGDNSCVALHRVLYASGDYGEGSERC